MLTKPTNWDSYLASAGSYYNSVLRVGNTEYDQDDIMSLTSSRNLFGDEYSLGGTVMSQYDATLYNVTANAVPKFSKVSVWTRVHQDATHYTDYVPMGVFYTKKPVYDPESKLLTISGYDEMFRTEQEPFGNSTVTTWNSPNLRQVAKHLLEGTTYSGTLVTSWSGCGISLEDETQIPTTITMSAPPYSTSVRQVLTDIAIACNGNWTVAFSGTYPTQNAKLRLVRNNTAQSFKGTVNLGRNVQSIEIGDDILDVDQVIINYGIDDDGTTLSKIVGEHSTGRIVELTINTIPDGNQAQAIAQTVYNSYQNDTYHSLSAMGSELQPIYELGDAITVNSLTSTIGNLTVTFSNGMFTDIEAQGVTESDDFPYLNASTNKVERDLRTVRAAIAVQANKIGLVVQEVAGENVIKAAEIALAIDDEPTAKINANRVYVNGETQFSSMLDTEGTTTTINGGKITADTIALNSIKCRGTYLTVKDSLGVTKGTLGEGIGYGSSTVQTEGVKLADATGNFYLIATNQGIRLQDVTHGHSLYLTANGIFYNTNNGSPISLGDAVARFG